MTTEARPRPLPWLGLLLAGSIGASASAEPLPLPPGSAARGRLVFVRQRCATCHVHPEVPRPPARGAYRMHIPLESRDRAGRNDAQLARAIVRPSGEIHPGRADPDAADPERSPMPSFAAALSVQDLADLVAFLRPGFRPRWGAAPPVDDGELVLPPGDAARGRRRFVRSRCAACHVVAGDPVASGLDQPPMQIPIGGDPADRRADAAIAGEITRPSAWVFAHGPFGKRRVRGDSPMPDLTRHLTVRDLSDLVAYLRPAYHGTAVRPR